MEALILYTALGSFKNEHFISMYQEEAKKRDIHLELVTNPSFLRQDVEFVINKTRDYYIARAFEEEGIKVFNSAFIAETANDKWKTYEFLKDKVRMVETYLTQDISPVSYPVVVKPRHGHGGQRVTLANNTEDYFGAVNYATDYTKDLFSGPEAYDGAVVQPAMAPGKDLRVYILGRKIVAGVMRKSEKDFKSNYSLGGEVEPVEISDEIREMVKTVTKLFDFSFAGIDFIFDNDGNPYLNEIEDAVGARMLYEVMPEINVPGMHLDYILSKLGN